MAHPAELARTLPYDREMVARPHKPGRVPKPQNPTEPRSSGTGCGGAPRLHRIAVSSGQAARYCFVSPGAILNWIADGQLPAQRTIGGQNRILVSDLRAFMINHRMSTASLDLDVGHMPPCWEFWRTSPRGASPAMADGCTDCPVFRSSATLCHEIRPFLPGGTLRAPACANCDYAAARRDRTSKEHAP